MSLRSPWPLAALLLAVACSNKDAAPAADGGSAPAAASGGATAGTSSGDADLADVASYRLTMDKIDRLYAAQRNMAVRMAALSPAERAAMEAKESEDGDDGSQSLDDMARRIEGTPVMAEAVREAGLSPREFATITMAMLQSAMAGSVLQMRPKDNQDSLVREMKANKENIEFMRANEATLRQKQEAMAAEMKRLGVEREG
jgi:AraC-like DNA-binding protein